tara:strand:- start:61 stop:990 length:930 start_codon:yes stop_codon:yes gene_type:complete
LSCEKRDNKPYLPQSSGNINHVSVVMKEADWESNLGEKTRNIIGDIYQGLPIDEPNFRFFHIVPKQFSGFSKHSRNIVYFQKDTVNNFRIFKNLYSIPQLFFLIQGEDEGIMLNYLTENKSLIINTIKNGERKEKIRRIKKSPSRSKVLSDRIGISLIYPSIYKKVKDTLNFVWLEKQILKGTLNIISYRLPFSAFSSPPRLKEVIKNRDSIGELYIPGRLKGTHMITERDYKPYFQKLSIDQKIIFQTKGIWEVKNDFMGGPFLNYILEDKKSKEWIVVEGFAFAPSVSKREYMFEIGAILSTVSINN